MLLKKPQFKAAGFLAALNCLMILRAIRYLFEINAVGSRTETEVVAAGATAIAFFVAMPLLVIRHELVEPEEDASVIFRLKRQIMLGLAYVVVLTPSICYLILLFRG